MTEQRAPGGITLAVVRQEQVYASAVVTGSGEEWSILPSAAFVARGARPRTGDLVAVRNDEIVYCWPRGLVLGQTPEGIRVRLGTREQIIAPANPETLPDAPALRPGDPVFASRDEVLARAWNWFEPEPPAPTLLARAAEVVARAER
jgi:hypothetical protein